MMPAAGRFPNRPDLGIGNGCRSEATLVGGELPKVLLRPMFRTGLAVTDQG
jgi:hypothetical protein